MNPEVKKNVHLKYFKCVELIFFLEYILENVLEIV